jgi:hypothetical protein
MKVKFADTFVKSLDRLILHQTWWYKTYHFLRYDIRRFITNIWRFRNALYNHYWWDYCGMLMFMETSLTVMADKTEIYGNEVEEYRLKKIEKMRRVVELIKNYNDSTYIELAEKELGELFHRDFEFKEFEVEGYYELVNNLPPEQKEHNNKVFDRAQEIEEQEWVELWETLKGQNYKNFDKDKSWDEQFDGSGLRGWWD